MAKEDNKDEEYKDENFDNSSEQDDEDFGLPDLDSDEESSEEADSLETSDSSDDFSSQNDESDDAEELDEYNPDPFGEEEEDEYELETEEEYEEPVGYNAPKKQSAAPIIVTLIIILLLAVAAVWFIFLREPKQEEPVVEKQVKDTSSYVVEKPVEPEPEVIEPEEPTVGVVNILSSRTGRSYVVVGSFFDEDLAKDYANEVIQKGTNAYVIPPFGKSKFNRVAIEETEDFSTASTRATELAGQYKEQPWPLKY